MKKWNSQILGIPLALLVLGFLTPNAMAQDSRADATNQDPRSGPSRAIPPSGPPRFQERVPPSQSNPHRSDRADGSETSPSAPPPVLAILAHPDDEILIAPILARMAREGGEVTVVFATSGEAGPGVSDMEPGEALAAVREDEARCAAFALGLPEPIFWQLGDGRLATQAHSPESQAAEFTERLTALLQLQPPRVIITWGPEGGYGHADHRMVSGAVTQLVQSMDEMRPDLLYMAIPSGSSQTEDGAAQGFEQWARTHPSLITDRMRYEIFDLEAARGAVSCYQSQLDDELRARLPSLLHQHVWQGSVHFRAAFPSQF